MRIRVLNGLLLIELLSILLIMLIAFVPASPARIVLGLPFVLFCPGYVLYKSLFPGHAPVDGIELVALSFGMSIVIVALIGLGLNFTSWGVRLEPLVSSLASFVILLSNVALVRQFLLPDRLRLWVDLDLGSGINGKGARSRSFDVILVVLFLSTLGIVAYTLASPKIGEKFTEFYLLGQGGQAGGLPSGFILDGGKATQVDYGTGSYVATDGEGKVIVGISSHEQEDTVYYLKIAINGQPVKIQFGGKILDLLGPLELKNNEKLEENVGFAPLGVGNNQKVDFLLFKNSETDPSQSLHLWINVRGPG